MYIDVYIYIYLECMYWYTSLIIYNISMCIYIKYKYTEYIYG